jgi:hypothetical protein
MRFPKICTSDAPTSNIFRRLATQAVVCCSLVVAVASVAKAQPAATDGQHDFDFEFGAWKTHISRLVHPLTGSKTWVQYDGEHIVSKLWNGRANIGTLEVSGPAGHIEGMSLNLYNPQSRQWTISFASSSVGSLNPSLTGAFHNGRGEFYDQETFGGRAVYVRNVFFDITPRSYRFEQSFSADGGKTWEPNWVAHSVLVKR